MLETTARSVRCQRCTNCPRQYCTADYYPRLDQIQAEDQAEHKKLLPNNRSFCLQIHHFADCRCSHLALAFLAARRFGSASATTFTTRSANGRVRPRTGGRWTLTWVAENNRIFTSPAHSGRVSKTSTSTQSITVQWSKLSYPCGAVTRTTLLYFQYFCESIPKPIAQHWRHQPRVRWSSSQTQRQDQHENCRSRHKHNWCLFRDLGTWSCARQLFAWCGLDPAHIETLSKFCTCAAKSSCNARDAMFCAEVFGRACRGYLTCPRAFPFQADPQLNLGRPQNSWYRTWLHQRLQETVQKTQKPQYWQTKESDMFEIKNGTKQDDPISSLLFNTVLQVALKDDLHHDGKRKNNGHLLRRRRSRLSHEFALCWRCALVRFYKGAVFKNMLCDFKHSTEKWDSRHIQEKTKILSSQSSKSRLTTSKWK